MNRIVIRSSRWKNILYALVGVVMLVVGVTMIEKGDEPVYGWLLTIGGALGTPLFAYIAFNRIPGIILDEEGIDLSGLGNELLPWSEVSMVYTDEQMRNYPYIVIELVDPDGLTERNPDVAPRIIGGKITIDGGGYDIGCDDIVDAMMRLRSGLKLTPEQIRASESIEDSEETV